MSKRSRRERKKRRFQFSQPDLEAGQNPPLEPVEQHKMADQDEGSSACPPLVKEVARQGAFSDMHGQRVVIDEKLIDELLVGTKDMMGHGFAIRAYSSHMTDDSKDVLGTWSAFFKAKGSLYGILQPHSAEASKIIEPLDASMVIEEEIEFDGTEIPIGLVRVDVVGQGAVIGTDKFRTVKAQMGQSLRALCCFQQTKKGVPMDRLMQVLSLALQLPEGADAEAVEAAFFSKFMPEEDEAEMAAKLSNAFMPEEAPAPEAEDDDVVVVASAPEDDDAAQMAARLQAEIEELQDDKVEASLQEVDDKAEAKAVKARFARVRKAGGFKLAFEGLAREVDLIKKSKTSIQFGTRIATRPGKLSKNQNSAPEENKLVSAALRMGFKHSKKGG